ncbi:hypothetical protein B5X24_HaOG207761 [Helicoverpa armigera]|nr:hypothetical protein B5X24_HaOG207761 [Helicoverpa armigera]
MYAELIAISEALSYIKSLESGNYVVLTDSKSALQHLARCTSSSRGTPIAYNIIRSLDELSRQNKNLILQWIPAHTGLIENEKLKLN